MAKTRTKAAKAAGGRLKPLYRRVLLKLSGESLCPAGGFGIESSALSAAVDEIMPLTRLGVQLAVVIGGGNFLRARELADDPNIKRVTADHMGMLGTIMNSLALRDAMEARGLGVRIMSALAIPTICDGFNRRRAIGHMENGRIVIFAGGTGSPFFTTDTTAALRASETGAELLIKATKVEGVYDSDPMINPAAVKLPRLTYQKVLEAGLGIMDLTAISLCMENRIPIVVCQLSTAGNFVGAVCGRQVGTLIAD